jgi:hypothetical protein
MLPIPYYKDTTGNRKNQNPLIELDAKKEAKFDKLTTLGKNKTQTIKTGSIGLDG